MTYKQAMDYIEIVNQYGSVLGLESMERLLTYFGHPEEELSFVHVAGTNGKGSTIAFLATALEKGKYRVGRYSSPVVQSYCERIQINGKSIPKKSLADYMERVKEACESIVEEGYPHPTAFEVETVIGFLYYIEKKCDLVLLETGLGGVLDATNVIPPPMVAIITSISRDHMAVLGNTIEEIATAKAGIIKTGCHVVTYDQGEEICKVIEKQCEKELAILHSVSLEDCMHYRQMKTKQGFTYKEWKNLQITLLGRHQVTNALLALEALEVLENCGFAVSKEAIYEGFYETKWFGRLTQISKKPLIYVDGAHNADSVAKLSEAVVAYFQGKQLICLVGMFRDKECEEAMRRIAPLATHLITLTPPDQERSLHGYELAQIAQNYHKSVTVADSVQEALEIACLLADQDTVILAFGSLSYLGTLQEILSDMKRNL
ncbi:MAG: folylpolyglutamate synthase/dihydrofolate synthase family protein [Eubacteriales bacterium]